jgi:APA family basic amino acid/polyamine antiporter
VSVAPGDGEGTVRGAAPGADGGMVASTVPGGGAGASTVPGGGTAASTSRGGGTGTSAASGARLARRLGTKDAVVVGLGAMLGAGIFSAPAPAARAAGVWLPLAVLLAGAVAWCNATSTARLAAVFPQSGGTYVYAGRLLGRSWGHLAGWGFVVGKTASCAAMALTVGAYAWPAQPRLAGTLALAVAVALGTGGVQRGARLTRVLLALTLAVLVVVVAAAVTGLPPAPDPGVAVGGLAGVPAAAGLMFFAFAGYARLATLGEEVRDPGRTIPRAVGLALLAAILIYLAVTVSALSALGPHGLAASASPLASVVSARGWDGVLPLVRTGAVAAAGGALLSLLLGVSRTAFAMASDGYLPSGLAAVRRGVPHRAELAVAVVVLALVWTVDLRGAIGFSSLAVLVYYLLANLSARRLGAGQRRPPGWLTAAGAAGCTLLALTLPAASVLAGLGVLAVGVVIRLGIDRRRSSSRPLQVR